MDIPPSTSALCIVKPLGGQVFSGLFSTHPPLSDRIAVLRNMTITRLKYVPVIESVHR